MMFRTTLNGKPCLCEVIACPPEPEGFQCVFKDSQGNSLHLTEGPLKPEDSFRLRDEYQVASFAQRYGIDF